MGVSLTFRGAEPQADGTLLLLDDPNLTFKDRLRQLFPLLDRMDRRTGRPGSRVFPWYLTAFDWDSGRPPARVDCVRPKEVIAAAQSLERQLQRYPKRYPPEWKFWTRQADGSRVPFVPREFIYRDRPCRLVSDEDGCFAVDITPGGPAFPVHFPLTEVPEISVRVTLGGPPAVLQVERVSPATVYAGVFSDLKRVCIAAMQRDVLLLPYYA